jgi:hypothetical protein
VYLVNADVSLLGGVDRMVRSMTVRDVDIRDASTLVGARIYSSAGVPIAVGDLLVPIGENQTINVPISATLTAGSGYRLAFFVPTSATGNNGNLFDPAPPGAGGFGYVETQGLFRINGGFQIIGDLFPATASASTIPEIGLEVAAVSEPSSIALLAAALIGLTYAQRRKKVPLFVGGLQAAALTCVGFTLTRLVLTVADRPQAMITTGRTRGKRY